MTLKSLGHSAQQVADEASAHFMMYASSLFDSRSLDRSKWRINDAMTHIEPYTPPTKDDLEKEAIAKGQDPAYGQR